MMSKKTKHPSFKSPTIIEAVVEAYFDKGLTPTQMQKLQNKLGARYDCKSDDLIFYNASFNPQGMTLQQYKPEEKRLKFTIGEHIFCQIYPDRFSFHRVGQYLGWAKFEDELFAFLKEIRRILPEISAQRIGVRFINCVKQKTPDQKVGIWLKSSPNYPRSILSAQQEYFYRCKWPTCTGRMVQICIAEAAATVQGNRPLMFDIDIIDQLRIPLKLNTLSKLIGELHNDVYNIFEAAITSHYRKKLNAEPESI